MTDILQLPGWAVSSTIDDGKRLVITAQYAKQPDSCQLCGLVGALYKHGPRSLTILDSPVRGRPSCIEARVQRYKCRDCNGTFLQPLEGIDTEHRMTERCLAYIQQQSLRDTFQRVSEHLGCDEKTVRNVANDYIDKFHVVKKANESVERTCIRLGKDQKAAVRKGWMRSKALLRMRYMGNGYVKSVSQDSVPCTFDRGASNPGYASFEGILIDNTQLS